VLEPGEQTKSLAQVEASYDRLIDFGADRRTLIVALGGGVIGDLAGFLAATYQRGILFLQVPTTLVAQVDSSVGGKVGVNHPRAKNLIGTFYQPVGVWIDTDVLVTLGERDYRSGLAEVVKYGVILDAEFFGWLEGHVDELRRRDRAVLGRVVARSCRLKADVVEKDEREVTGVREVLNYGHTFAHAIETVAGYDSERFRHGEAVAIGMVAASRLAESIGWVGPEVTQRQARLLAALELPTLVEGLEPEALLEAMQRDKKARGGRLRFVLPRRIGAVETCGQVDRERVLAVLETITSASAAAR